ncbi:MAG TPA: hypothetical protein VMR98_03870, partial [Candidatus Polarisedimenticolaceae bacterium]|nr:hypothetical protein [Candidatus Polarisedimenticolaceae bacterium]
INVFGSWTGSAGVDTAAGTVPASPAVQLAPLGAGGGGLAAILSDSSQAKTRVSHSGGSAVGTVSAIGANPDTTTVQTQSLPNAIQTAVHGAKVAAAQTETQTTGFLIVLAAFMMLLAGGALSLERKLKTSNNS